LAGVKTGGLRSKEKNGGGGKKSSHVPISDGAGADSTGVTGQEDQRQKKTYGLLAAKKENRKITKQRIPIVKKTRDTD